MSLSGIDFVPLAQEMLDQAKRDSGDANLWMNLAIVMLCLGQREVGLAIQEQALALERVYHLAASERPARLRLLMLMAQGDLASNAPLECLLEGADIDLDFYYVSHGAPFALPVPEHDVVFVGISESDENRSLLASLEEPMARWPKPVVNAPRHVPSTGRAAASMLLGNVTGLLIPPTLRVPRTALLGLAAGELTLGAMCDGWEFPVIVRPVDSHAGRGLDKIDGPGGLAAYLTGVDEPEFFLSPFVDYSGPDGLFRKIRVALVGGKAFACHMAVSSKWMIHYVNADMYEEEQERKREEECLFMEHFEDFAQRHRTALDAIYKRAKLEYLCVDCAETRDGQLLVFEINHAMVVHAMDPERLFPYKQRHMRKVRNAMRDFLFGLASAQPSARHLNVA